MSGPAVPAARTAAVYAVSCLLLLTGAGLALRAGEVPLAPAFDLPALLLVPLYLAVLRRPLEFEYRRGSVNVTLTHLPLTLGVLLVAPGAHLLARGASSIADGLWRRIGLLKTTFNVAVGAFEVGVAAAAIGLVGAMEQPGPALWMALVLGLLVGDVLGSLALQGALRLMGVRLAALDALRPVGVAALTSVLFTGVAIVAVSAAWLDPWTLLVTLSLASLLALAYRGYRHQSARERSADRLYHFVSGLGPVDAQDAAALDVLEQVRELLHARHLELALSEPAGGWRRLTVRDDDAVPDDGELAEVTVEVAQTGAPALTSADGAQRMATPLVTEQGVLGVLTAHERLGSVRGFDLRDLRLLETVAAELATALERGRLQRDLERAATRDPLTSLPNLRELTRQLQELVGQAPDGQVLLAAVAVDSYREVNDSLGHDVGDALLVEVGRRLRGCSAAGAGGVVGRIGDGRFAVAAPAHRVGGDAALFGLALRTQVEGSAQIGPAGTHVRLSVGVVRAPEHGTDAATLIRRAETAMYGARTLHGGPVVWEPAYEVQGQRRLALVAALREAIAGGALGVVFQPKVETASGRVTGAEALARWTHPALGAVSPEEFVPLAEAAGLMGALTTCVLRQSLLACREWQAWGPVGVAVNVSADTVLDPQFVTEVAVLLHETGVSAGLLTLELTESVVVSDPRLAAERMGELRALGVALSVDDFGTGYSSLTYLKGLPVDEVKVDRGFVDQVASDPADRAVIRAVVDIAHTLGLRVVAEGVERESQHEVLRALAVDEVQGYLHAQPMPAAQVAAWLRGRTTRSRA